MSECMEKNKEHLCDSNTEIKTLPPLQVRKYSIELMYLGHIGKNLSLGAERVKFKY